MAADNARRQAAGNEAVDIRKLVVGIHRQVADSLVVEDMDDGEADIQGAVVDSQVVGSAQPVDNQVLGSAQAEDNHGAADSEAADTRSYLAVDGHHTQDVVDSWTPSNMRNESQKAQANN